MAVNSENLVSMIHRTHFILRHREEKIFSQHGLTTEQYEVLTAVKHLDEPVRVVDMAQYLARTANTISMIVDRMFKAGLLNRVRDEEKDRRIVHLSITDKAETMLIPATLAGKEFVRETRANLSQEDEQHLLRVLVEIAESNKRER
jgi:DNA-binding MarR family transcriptional regulator